MRSRKLIIDAQISPYDKIGTMIARKMKVPIAFKKKSVKGNQNAMKQRTYEHQITPLNKFININESNMTNFKQQVFDFLDHAWQEDIEIELIEIFEQYRDKFETASDEAVRDYFRRMYSENIEELVNHASDGFISAFEDISNIPLNNRN